TMRLAERGHEVVGLTVHVPQYLHEMSYPDAAIALLGAITEESGPQLPVESLEAQAGPVREAISAQIDAQPALQEMVSGLEARVDRMITSRARAEGPTAAALAGEVAQHLATRTQAAARTAAEVEQYLARFDQEAGGTDESKATGEPDGPTPPPSVS